MPTRWRFVLRIPHARARDARHALRRLRARIARDALARAYVDPHDARSVVLERAYPEPRDGSWSAPGPPPAAALGWARARPAR